MHRQSYTAARTFARFLRVIHVRHVVVHADRLHRPGAYVLACTHAGHLEPALLSATMRRPVHWVARVEFFRFRWAALLLRRLGAIPIDRRGVPVGAVRESLKRLGDGEIIGIFPEGGRTIGPRQAILGGPVRGGACLIATRADVPVVPVVVCGIDALQHASRWLPGRRNTVRTIVGLPIYPDQASARIDRRKHRRAMTARLGQAFLSLHQELQIETGGAA